jgi:BirA family biotin operon repressor/biotin-[acetyl-CoA-carboxylase] ligase
MKHHQKGIPTIIRLQVVASTNQYMQDCILKERLPEGSVVVADYQTEGRGQAGNVWESAAGFNLTCSFVFYPELAVNRQFIFSQLAALAVKATLDDYTAGISLKWPNDIYWRDKKMGGILIENNLLGDRIQSLVIGIGLNINQTRFAGGAPNPVSLCLVTGHKQDREEILRRLQSKLCSHYLGLLQGEEEAIRRDYLQALYRGEGFFAFADSNERFDACIAGVSQTGRLSLQLRDGSVREYAFKEVRFL